ncbi:MAG: NUDIX hydrolase [Cyclobacteriaceae bacterium]
MSGNPLNAEIAEKYGNRVRIRVCGLYWRASKLLMVNHRAITKGNFWAPPGGGVDFGQSATEALTREFQEETGLHITPGEFLFACEFISPPLHAVELFFAVHDAVGNLSTGIDPESLPDMQIIQKVEYLDFNTILAMPPEERHGIFRLAQSVDDLKKLHGFYRI